MNDGKRQNSLEIKAFSVCRYYIVTPHLRESDAQNGALAQGSAGLFRAFHRECNFKYLHSFGLEQQGKCRKSHGKRGKITPKRADRKQMGELKKPYATRLFRGSGENFRVLSKPKISGEQNIEKSA